jgi:hypothetical protein
LNNAKNKAPSKIRFFSNQLEVRYTMATKKKVKWLAKPAEDDYGAAENFLQLLFKPKKVRRWAKQLRQADVTEYLARDILRATGTSILEVQAFDWSKQQKEIDEGKCLAPILIVRQDNGGHLIIADGFHRLCALFAHDQEVKVQCKIV